MDVFKILKNIKQNIIKYYSPDEAFRYLPVARILKNYGKFDFRILDVGSGDAGICPYIKQEVHGLDVSFGERTHPRLKPVVYDGNRFPFADNSFEAVISVDSLEHINPDDRQAHIDEIMRVAEQTLIIVVPCGQAAERQDSTLASRFQATYGKNGRFLEEHCSNGLPDRSELMEMLASAAKKFKKKTSIIRQGGITNLKFRGRYMKLAINRSILAKSFYYSLLLLIPFWRILNIGKCYRYLVQVKIE